MPWSHRFFSDWNSSSSQGNIEIGKQDLFILGNFGIHQLLVGIWFDVLGDNTVADAVLDRLVDNAHRLELKGDSLRKKR